MERDGTWLWGPGAGGEPILDTIAFDSFICTSLALIPLWNRANIDCWHDEFQVGICFFFRCTRLVNCTPLKIWGNTKIKPNIIAQLIYSRI